ncbi:hypothetical protein N0V90_004169 [Kalmusia sp. IMI 367209]|nr:hypothetical protein N0V90_004169 [Kalmusia sp. IMI 367209]
MPLSFSIDQMPRLEQRNSAPAIHELPALTPDRDNNPNQGRHAHGNPQNAITFVIRRWWQTLDPWIQIPRHSNIPNSREDDRNRDGDVYHVPLDPGAHRSEGDHTVNRPESDIEDRYKHSSLDQNNTADFQTASDGTTAFYSAAEAASIATNGSIRIISRRLHSVDNQHLARARRIGITRPREHELDWSGHGQHVQFTNESEVPLQPIRDIARTGRAIVDAVKCRRICLARKRMLCHRRFKPEEALEEVRHMQLLQHRHIVRCIGTYSLGKWVAILTYPVARCNLEEFLRETSKQHEYNDSAIFNRKALVKFFACLSCVIEYIHGEGVKHMDIKPQNILVNMRYSDTAQSRSMDIYIADFGISRMADPNQSQTDGPTGRTETYCSPEVANGGTRGRSSDMFSLGCVFAEMATVISGQSLDDFLDFRSDDGSSYHRNIPLVCAWVYELKNATVYWDKTWKPVMRDTIIQMLSEEPDLRPTASDLRLMLGPNPCCLKRQEDIVADP